MTGRESRQQQDQPPDPQPDTHRPSDGRTGGEKGQPMTGTDQLRADAETWRRKAIRRALTISRLRGTIDALTDLADEPVTDPGPRGDGYRAAIVDLREVLREFGHLEAPHPAAGEWLHAGTRDLSIPTHDTGPDVAECAAADRNWDVERHGE